MIYLFEDRIDRMRDLLNVDINEFKDALDSSKTINTHKDDLPRFFSSLSDLEVVMLHKSYSFADNTITPDSIKEITKKLGKKFVLFSGGLDNAIIDDIEITINSETLYKNLQFFIENSIKNQQTNLVYLVFSSHSDYLKHQLKKIQNEVLSDLYKANIENLGIIFKQIRNKIDTHLVSNEYVESKSKLIDYINKKIEQKDFDRKILFEQIQKMIEKYENN